MGHEDADLGEKRNLSVTGHQGTAASAWKGSHGALRTLANPYFPNPKTIKEEERVELVLFANLVCQLQASTLPYVHHDFKFPLLISGDGIHSWALHRLAFRRCIRRFFILLVLFLLTNHTEIVSCLLPYPCTMGYGFMPHTRIWGGQHCVASQSTSLAPQMGRQGLIPELLFTGLIQKSDYYAVSSKFRVDQFV